MAPDISPFGARGSLDGGTPLAARASGVVELAGTIPVRWPERFLRIPSALVADLTFTDSAGVFWEVFEVHRVSATPRGVSPGLERGWLTFASEGQKRRVAPYPADWAKLPAPELERLCASARVAAPPRFPVIPRRRPPGSPRRMPPGLAAPDSHAPTSQTPLDPLSSPPGTSTLEMAVRAFAHRARADSQPAVAALMALKAHLAAERSDHADADPRSIRRWFIESFYFEHG